MALPPKPQGALAYSFVEGFTASPGTVNNGTVAAITATIRGLATNMSPIVWAPSLAAGLYVIGAAVTAKNTLTVYIFNPTGSPVVDTSQNMRVIVL